LIRNQKKKITLKPIPQTEAGQAEAIRDLELCIINEARAIKDRIKLSVVGFDQLFAEYDNLLEIKKCY